MNGNISNVIDKKIEGIIQRNNIFHLGKVTKVTDYIIEASGLDDAFFFEKVFIGSEENIGYVEKIDENKVYISLVKTNGQINIGSEITETGEVLQTMFSKNALGMIIDPFGTDRMSNKKFNESKVIDIETPKIPIMDRTAVNRPLETGIAVIDLMYPIGKGQRQLIIGDKKTGKTQICLDTIVNQNGKNVICIYVSIGKTKKELKRLYTKLVEKGANSYTIIVAAFNDDPAPLIKLTPYVGLSIAEEFMKEGKDVLVCIDDLKKHADACREIALISEKNTGRDAYPADIFYTHSRLLEKGCQHKNGGSITILPIVETKNGDITDYISTNIISITDGQLVLSEKMFKKGQKPAVSFGLSVSRLGGAVQRDDIKKIGSEVRRKLLSYLETADVYQLVAIESLSDDLQDKLYKGQELLRLLNQNKFSPMSQDRLVEVFGYNVGMGESSTVKELLRYISKSNEVNTEESLVSTPKPKPAPVQTPQPVEPQPVVQEVPEENTVKSIYDIQNDDVVEISFMNSNDIGNEFNSNPYAQPAPQPVVPPQQVQPVAQQPVAQQVPVQPVAQAPVQQVPTVQNNKPQ
ncbi:MAG: F0F1 ATP synthase subunit alpha [Bacilli bacterium]|nr:F0F1 ATP synthase subunit alpha [Bacilli bacterium]